MQYNFLKVVPGLQLFALHTTIAVPSLAARAMLHEMHVPSRFSWLYHKLMMTRVADPTTAVWM
jgi:hypothetical protein